MQPVADRRGLVGDAFPVEQVSKRSGGLIDDDTRLEPGEVKIANESDGGDVTAADQPPYEWEAHNNLLRHSELDRS